MNIQNNDFFSEEEMGNLQKIALEELRELCDDLARIAPVLRGNPADADARKRAVHIFHTIGGSAALAGFMDISTIGVALESALKKAHKDKPLDGAVLDHITHACGQLDTLITQAAAASSN